MDSAEVRRHEREEEEERPVVAEEGQHLSPEWRGGQYFGQWGQGKQFG